MPFGNRLFNTLYRTIFGPDFTDIFSGYRAFSRRFVKSFPAVSGGFEIETEMSVHASRLKLPVAELELDYGRRPEGSHSKLSTFKDGAKILWMFAMLMKETRPFAFFGILAALFMGSSIVFMTPVLISYFETGLVQRMPTWVLSMALMMIAFMLFTAGTDSRFGGALAAPNSCGSTISTFSSIRQSIRYSAATARAWNDWAAQQMPPEILHLFPKDVT